jgi:glutamate-1-semialdehyde 2,1-aminomutase
VQATGIGSLLNIHFSRRPVLTPDDAHPRDPAAEKALLDLQKLFHLDLIDQGYYFARRGFLALSLPTTEADIEGFAAAVTEFFESRAGLIERSLPQG